MGGLSATVSQTPACPRKANANVVMDWRWECLALVSTKFEFIWLEGGIASRVASKRCRPILQEKLDGARPPSEGRRDIRRGARRPLHNRIITPRGTSVARLFG